MGAKSFLMNCCILVKTFVQDCIMLMFEYNIYIDIQDGTEIEKMEIYDID